MNIDLSILYYIMVVVLVIEVELCRHQDDPLGRKYRVKIVISEK